MNRLLHAAGIFIGLFMLFAVPLQAQTTVFINEIHYDNTSTDEGEAIEIAGPAGTDLTNWEIVLYNGSSGVVYDSDVIDATIPDDGSGFGFVTISYPSNGIQNGSPDGIVLSDGINVIQFLSYEGSFTAVGGVADGMTSTDIGVAESSSTPIGNSMQLMGNGSVYEDFTWSTEVASTFDDVNAGQTFESSTSAVVFINEIHYDNDGTDEGEEIEIAGTAGTDLTGWQIVLYNGSNGTVYDTDDIGGTIPDDGSGFGFVTIAYPSNGIQNGGPDGVVLSDGTNVIQFLSYEGSFTAVDGIANGMTSTDIGVSESSSTPIGNSLQLVGTGLRASDFTWAADMPSTFGAVNAGQVFGENTNDTPVVTITEPADGAAFEEGAVVTFTGTATDTEDGDLSSSIEWVSSIDGSIGTGASIMVTLSVGTHMITASATDSEFETGTDEISVTVNPVGGVQTAVFINEIHYDNDGTDEGEEIEIAGPAGTDLTGWQIVLYNGSNGTVYDTDALSGTIPDDGSGFGFVTIAYPSNGIQNGSPDGIVLSDGINVIQFLSYEGALTAVGGIADGMTSTDIGVSESSSTPIGNSLQLTGTGTVYEDFTWATDMANTFGAVNTGQEFEAQALAFVNEIHYDNDGGDEGEAIEIAGRAGTDLTGWSIVLYNGSNGTQYNSVELSGTIPDDGSGFGFVTEFISGIQNGSPDGIVLANGSEVVQFLSYEGTFTAVGGVADGQESIDIGVSESSGTPIGNSLQLTGTGTQASDFTWASDMPNTFGTVNTGQEFGEGGGIMVKEIYEIQGSGLVSPFENTIVRTENNVVIAVGPEGFFIQTPSERTDGDVETSDGIYVFTDGAPGVAVGDLVDVEGQVIEFFDLTEFSNGPTVTVVGTGTVPAAIVFDETLPSTDAPESETTYERYEGMLVTIPNGLVSGPSQSFGSDPEAEAYVVANGVQPFREPGIIAPGIEGLPVWDGNPEVFEIDPDKLGLDNVLFTRGSTFSATGALAFEFGEYEVWLTELTVNNLVDLPVPVRTPGESEGTIGSLNLLRLDIADSDYASRIAKFSAYIRTVLLSPDIIAVQEVQDIATLTGLAEKLNDDDPSLSYEAYLVEGNDQGGIDVGYLVNANAVQVNAITQLAADETLTFDGSLLHDRPPLLLEAQFLVFGVPTVAVEVLAVHNRSLNGINDPSGGERVRIKRLEQAQSIAQIVQDRQTANADVKLTVIGDFNAFEFTDGFVDVVGQISGNANPADNLVSGDDLVEPDLTNQVLSVPQDDRYSFIFSGSAQVLDHALTSSAFNPHITGLAFGRGNAGAPEVLLDDASTPLASSDHDGLVMYVELQNVFPATAVLAAENSVFLDRSTAVESGDILVAGDAEGDVLGGSSELVIGRRATTPAGFQVKADGITVFPDAVVDGDVSYNTLDNFGIINGTETSPLELPVFDAPPFPDVTAGTENVSVRRNTEQSLDPGAYGHVIIRGGSTLILTGGEYHVKSLTILSDAELLFDGITDLRIEERLMADRAMHIGPVEGSGFDAADMIMYVAGINGKGGELGETPVAAEIGQNNDVRANLFVPNGSLIFEGNTVAEGSFIARDIHVGRNTSVALNSYWAAVSFQPVAQAATGKDELAKETIAQEVPDTYALGQNYPNPFNPTTSIPFSLPEASHVRLVVYDMLGRVVDTVIDGELNAGYHNATFDASTYPSGTYVYRIEASGFTSTQKMVLVK